MHKNWRWFIPGYIWCIHLTLGYLLFAVIAQYKPHSWRIHRGVITFISERMLGRPKGQTVGAASGYASEEQFARVDLHEHENVHIVQAFLFGIGGLCIVPPVFAAIGWSPLLGLGLSGFIGTSTYALLYGIFFLWFFALQGFKDWKKAYHRNPFEKQAFKLQADKEIKSSWV